MPARHLDPDSIWLAVEIGDWDRFTGSTIGAYPWLVPTEHSSGAFRSQGSITKTGNTHARRLLVEAAWHHRRPYDHPSRLMPSGFRSDPRAHGPTEALGPGAGHKARKLPELLG
nr:transposase [Arthrobacter sp. H-02-3]